MTPSGHQFNREAFMLFCRKQQRYETGLRSLVFLVPYMGGMLLFALPIQRVQAQPAWALLWFPAFFGYLILFPFVWMRFLVPKECRKYLKCPSCLKPTGSTNRMVIIATGKCGHCGEIVLADPNR